jgi:hypothetical protein
MRITFFFAALVPLVISSSGEKAAEEMSPGLSLWAGIGKALRLSLRGSSSDIPALQGNVSFPDNIENVTGVPFYRVSFNPRAYNLATSRVFLFAYRCRRCNYDYLTSCGNMLALNDETSRKIICPKATIGDDIMDDWNVYHVYYCCDLRVPE